MADPPWDIHMELPYGTMADDEMRRMNVQVPHHLRLIFPTTEELGAPTVRQPPLVCP